MTSVALLLLSASLFVHQPLRPPSDLVTEATEEEIQGSNYEKTEEVTGRLEFYCPPTCSLEQLISSASRMYGIPPARLRCLVFRESSNNPNAENGPYLGYGQFDLPTWNTTSYRNYPRTNGWANIHATAELLAHGAGTRTWPPLAFCP